MISRQDFESLRDLPNKTISEDIVFRANKNVSPNLTFEKVKVQNTLGYDIELNGTYKPSHDSSTFNFIQRGVGPICRFDINSTVHKDVGRTHKHTLHNENDPSRNLPVAHPRPDLDGKSVQEIWKTICKQSKIKHQGRLILPKGY
jgi:hypothetical protein